MAGGNLKKLSRMRFPHQCAHWFGMTWVVVCAAFFTTQQLRSSLLTLNYTEVYHE